MGRSRHETDLQRAHVAALAGLGIALAAVLLCLVAALLWTTAVPGDGPWIDQESVRAVFGLAVSDTTLAAVLLLALIVVTLVASGWPRLLAALWALAGLTLLVTVALAAGELFEASTDVAGNRAVLDSGGEWLLLSPGMLAVLAALFATAAVAALVLLFAARGVLAQVPAHEREWSLWLRLLLALPLACGVASHLSGVAASLAMGGQSVLFYAVSVLLELTPAMAYGAAAVLLVGAFRHRVTWLVLLLFGATLGAAFTVSLLQYGDWGELMVLPLYLVVLAIVQVWLMPSRQPTVT